MPNYRWHSKAVHFFFLYYQYLVIIMDKIIWGWEGFFPPENIYSFKNSLFSNYQFPSPGDLSDPGIKPESPTLQADSLPFHSPGKHHLYLYLLLNQLRRTSSMILNLHTRTRNLFKVYLYFQPPARRESKDNLEAWKIITIMLCISILGLMS